MSQTKRAWKLRKYLNDPLTCQIRLEMISPHEILTDIKRMCIYVMLGSMPCFPIRDNMFFHSYGHFD